MVEQFPNEMKTIEDFQAFHRWLDERKRRAIDCTADALLSRDYSELLLTR